jgi:diguanylate cyclase (GGDEF)-like protein
MVVAFDVIMVVIHLPIDISLLGYCAVSIEICYYTLWYVPKSMISSTLANAVQMADMGVICFDFQGNCIYLNIQGRQILERYYGMTLNNNLNELEDFFSDWLAKNWKDSDLEREITEKRESKLGEKYFSITVQKLLDEEHNHLGYYMNLQDRTVEQKYFNEQLFRISHDEVTGLYNTQYFQQKVSEMLHQFPDTPYVLVTSDIKDFKFINDFFGREIGDDLLKMHAKLLREMQGPNAVYGRVGIDKFAYCMPKERYSEHMFLQAMDVLVQEFTNKFFKIQIDMAVYEIQDIDEPVYQMCDKCDFAIDKIKADYSTRIAYYDENMLEEEMKKNAIINEFDKSLMNGEFQMYLQAQTTADGRMVGAEALARWIHPDKGLIPPGEFIPVLEEAGLIYRLDLYIWNQAAKTLAQWKAAGKDNFTISVNISAQDQYYLDIYKVFTELVTTYHIDPINLKLEITESIFITEVEKHLHLINQLQAYGFEVEIDDFGSGYSSLNILKDIAADVIKIDMGFLRETDNAARSRDIIAAVIRLAKSLHMTVITEGVETKEQVEALDAMGCDIYQGYYFAKPIPLKEFEDKYHIYFK